MRTELFSYGTNVRGSDSSWFVGREAALDHRLGDFYIAEMYIANESNRLRMADLTTFIAGDITDAKIRCEAWASCSPARTQATHLRLRRRESGILYLRAIAPQVRRDPAAKAAVSVAL